jgi:excinuclease ABC subunit C
MSNKRNINNPVSKLSYLRQQAAKMPAAPGVYIIKDAQGDVLYIGKAKRLRQRVQSYFRSSSDERYFIRFLHEQATDIACIITPEEKDALILENQLIKKHKPKYNIRLRDDKRYIMLAVSVTHPFARVRLMRAPRRDEYCLGPFPNTKALRKSLDIALRYFPLRTCSNAEFARRKRPCLRHEIGTCSAPCTGLISREHYKAQVESFIRFFSGSRKAIINDMKKKMKQAAGMYRFEKAQKYYQDIQWLEEAIAAQAVVVKRGGNIKRDVFAFSIKDTWVSMAVLFVREGIVSGMYECVYDCAFTEDDLVQSIFAFYTLQRDLPHEIRVPLSPHNRAVLQDSLREVTKKPVKVAAARQGACGKLYRMAQKNADEISRREESGRAARQADLEELKTCLHLQNLPRNIVCFDISDTSGTMAVGAHVWMKDLVMDRNKYRLFNIRLKKGPDDYAMMAEAVSRACAHFIEDDMVPELIVIDGGAGHLQRVCALPVIKGCRGLDIIAIAKDRAHRGPDRIILPDGSEIPVAARQPYLLHIVRIRDEVHRFALMSHRKRRIRENMLY